MASLCDVSKATILIVIIGLYATTTINAKKSFCTEDEQTKAPCLCCKMRCWYNIQEQAKTVLGHMPGTRGEGEAVETLSTMSQCMSSLCSGLCEKSGPNRRQLLLAALNKEMQQPQ